MKIDLKRLEYEMDRQNLTYESLSSLMNKSRTYSYYFLKNPDVKLSTIQALADALNINAKDLITLGE